MDGIIVELMVELMAMGMMVMAVEVVEMVVMVVEMRMMVNVSPLVESGGAVGAQSNNRSLINHSLLFRPITCETYATSTKAPEIKD